VAVELLVALPIVLAVLLGMIEFSMLLVARQQILVASREGARVAALGGTADDVDKAVHQFLGTGSLAGAQVQAQLTDQSGQPVPSGGAVAVTVSLPTAQAVPDLLRFIGFSLGNDVLTVQTVMRKE
jgi:Flp pilus assembly protein TadG